VGIYQQEKNELYWLVAIEKIIGHKCVAGRSCCYLKIIYKYDGKVRERNGYKTRVRPNGLKIVKYQELEKAIESLIQQAIT